MIQQLNELAFSHWFLVIFEINQQLYTNIIQQIYTIMRPYDLSIYQLMCEEMLIYIFSYNINDDSYDKIQQSIIVLPTI